MIAGLELDDLRCPFQPKACSDSLISSPWYPVEGYMRMVQSCTRGGLDWTLGSISLLFSQLLQLHLSIWFLLLNSSTLIVIVFHFFNFRTFLKGTEIILKGSFSPRVLQPISEWCHSKIVFMCSWVLQPSSYYSSGIMYQTLLKTSFLSPKMCLRMTHWKFLFDCIFIMICNHGHLFPLIW